MANDLLHVRGILLPVAASTDRGTIFMTEGMFRELMVVPTGAHRIIARAPAGVSLDDAGAAVAAMAPDAHVRTWKQLNPLIAQMLDAVQVQMAVVYFVLYFAVGILILNAMSMAVFERIRELGVLKAIGYGPGQVLVMMLLEGLIQATLAAGLGLLLAAPCMVYLQVHGLDVGGLGGTGMMGLTMPALWHGKYTLEVVRVPIGMLFGVVLAAVIWPAVKAARLSPLDAMHHQ
jgi:ABC-type antimicrobial peptide transport system permease subunit